MKALSVVVLSLTLSSCTGIQTEPTCKVEEYGIIQFSNATDDYKTIAVYRLKFDSTDGRYKTVGKPHTRLLEPMVVVRLRLHPGIVLVVVEKINGKRWVSDPLTIRTCGTTPIDLKGAVLLVDTPIPSRRQGLRRCPPCPECYLPSFPGPLIIPLTPKAP